MADFKEANVETYRSAHNADGSAGYGMGSKRSGQKLDVSLLSQHLDRH
jgi:hypothetical protein